MGLAQNIEAIRAIVAAVEGVANVQPCVRNWQSEREFRQAARTATGSVQFWFLTREATEAEDVGPRLTARRHRIVLHGYAGVSDAARSEQDFQALVEDVVAALDADRRLSQTARHSGPAQVRAVDFRVINNVLCHHAEVAIEVEDKPA